MKIRRLLCPVDFSDNSDLALDYGISVARQHRAEISTLHVLPKAWADPYSYPYLSEPILPTEATRERAYKQLGEVVRRAREEGLPSDVILNDGEVVDNILEVAERLPADLIVMGTHGRHGLSRWLMGSVAERVVRLSRRPVLTVSPQASAPRKDEVPFRRILCPVDFSPPSKRALDLALAIAGDEGEVTVIHVFEFHVGGSAASELAFAIESVREQRRAEAEENLGAVVPETTTAAVKTEVAGPVESGAYREILRVAERDDSELIVMGVMGRSGADVFFFGSTANHVVRSATCPVVTVRR